MNPLTTKEKNKNKNPNQLAEKHAQFPAIISHKLANLPFTNKNLTNNNIHKCSQDTYPIYHIFQNSNIHVLTNKV